MYRARKYMHDCEEHDSRVLVHKAMLYGHVGFSIQELTNVRYNVEVILKDINDQIAKTCGQAPVNLHSFPGTDIDSQR